MSDADFEVEVAYATEAEQLILTVEGAPGMTVEEAIRRSGIVGRFPEIDLTSLKVGVFGKAARLDADLNPGDRVEIYRPLVADPKEARKKRASEGKAMKKGGGRSDQ
ncbi:MAG: RnfH family protein [Candidatus Sedimenticola endophacoides]|uniref:UPF0125 protein C3L24_11775 n=1 Tax=Candidatus Sedimenticola endophacoides TaxID=2548426 RepID=A0A657PTG6_9GAMM|nr:MAG: RnfH family protein [Candidatus Sedimenticola endophacoides]OQX36744.1 MAG: RnfH family protein [Candidatus Sedimenticola endophacoides]OQX39631.1 MAG: RnfH family protein [Candidatus Sedimenticola endophacoides]OQX43600.1 MAG: RnfH family protein [Candidatus Sedimenticola endophacoides]OQX46261.1 MAG: RnfH family protein [Candidatus Sedimenticola endophacoides]